MSLLQKIRQSSKLRFLIIESLDNISAYVCSTTYKRAKLDTTPDSKLFFYITTLTLLGVVIAYGFLSHYSQEREYRKNFESYLVKGEYVLTTNDAGYYLTMAKNYQSSKVPAPPEIFPESLNTGDRQGRDVQIVGRILPVMISGVSSALNVSLEKAGVFITYGSVFLTAIFVFTF